MTALAALALAGALLAPTPPAARTRPALILHRYADAGYPGDLGLVAVETYPSDRAARDSNRTNYLTSTLQAYSTTSGPEIPSPRGTWTRLVMTPELCVAVSGGVRGRTAVMATDESVSGAGSPNCVAEVRWAQRHAVAALRAVTR